MKNILKTFCSLAAALLLTAVSHATPFDFSYVFEDGTTVTGTLDGTANGSYVDNITNLTMAFNGTAVTGPLFLAQFDGTDFVTGGVVSFDTALNNFLFINGDLLNGGGFDSYFTLHPDGSDPFASLHSDILGLDTLDGTGAVHAWSLTASPSAVPDGGATVAFLGLATLGLVGLRRRLAV